MPGAPRPARPVAPGARTSTAHYDLVRQLFREHNRALVNFLLTRLASEQEARDVAQEAYVRLLQLDQTGAISFLRGYLFRIAANISVDHARHRVVHERVADLFDELADIPGTEHEAITREEFDIACSALEELPPNCRQAFVLHVIEGYRTPEVARTMGIDQRTVRKYVTRALVRCRARLAQGEGEGT